MEDMGDLAKGNLASSKWLGTFSLLYAEVVVSFASAIVLLVLTVVQLLYRTSWRARKLWRVGNEVRFDGERYLAKPEGDIGRKILERGIKSHENVYFERPSGTLPPIVANDCDARVNCLSMIAETRKILYKQYGEPARLMSMRCCLSCIENVLPSSQAEDFLRIYESVLYGQYRADGVPEVISDEEIKFLHVFYHNSILKEIQW
ncbi:uncharacterized protein TEOVI_000651400 [Trypanosoma equiperdum]|uniref:Uncharacterized protein n=2 Tax=Trypanozoon TaxID=39700 RepID=Q38BA4_TRYB2|nr:hypothetical protein, conserved [Trypanosoma brucei brucei TREU927]EAN77916.1 hypothetical protein, conserved [Trypanosoma brucei brucei TREU927]SCU65137.1 hypothetical protein, conserved [Trypanosoma equiperdum]